MVGSSAAFPELNWATQGHAAESEYQRTQRLAREMEQLLARRRREKALRSLQNILDCCLFRPNLVFKSEDSIRVVAGAEADPFAEEKAAEAAAVATAVQASHDEDPADAWDASGSSDDDSAAWDSRAADTSGSKANAAAASVAKTAAVKASWAAAAAPPPKSKSKLSTPEPEPEPALEEPQTELLRILGKGGPASGAEEDEVTRHLNALHGANPAETASAGREGGESAGKKKNKKKDKGAEDAFEMATLDGSVGVTLLRLLFLSQEDQPTGVLAWFKKPSHAALLQRLCPSPIDQSMLWGWCASRLDELPPTLSWLGEKSPNAASKLLLLLYNADILEVRPSQVFKTVSGARSLDCFECQFGL